MAEVDICAIFSDKHVSEGRRPFQAPHPPAKRGATCHHAGQLLRPGDGADAARLHDGRSDFAGPSLLPVSSQDGCEGLSIKGVHHVSGRGHVGIPARTKHTQPN